MKKDRNQLISDVIIEMMERVIDMVSNKDPFILDKWKVENPLYTALVPYEIFMYSHFERSFVAIFESVWAKLAQVIADNFLGFAKNAYSINGAIREGRLKRIIEIVNKLNNQNPERNGIVSNWDDELNYILKGKGNLIPVTVVCDLYIENNGKRYAFELKSPLSNSNNAKAGKEKILKLYSMQQQMIDDAFFALPYNPYIDKENHWTFPAHWFNMKTDKVNLIGDEFWSFIGGDGTYEELLNCFERVGIELKEEIDQYFAKFE